MKWLNSNSFHNLANWALLGIGVVETVAVATGCKDIDPSEAKVVLDCSGSFLPPQYAGMAVAVIAGAKSLTNIVRDGLGGLFKAQPPVVTTLPVIPVKTTPTDVKYDVKVDTSGGSKAPAK